MKTIYLVLDAIIFLAMIILLVRADDVSWLNIFMGFVMGLTFCELLIFFRDRKSKTKKLR